ncbi:RING finger protein 112-like isoform 2-T2 [Mantella aurantiaca]
MAEGLKFKRSANMDGQGSFRPLVICDLCCEEVQDFISNPCEHVFCWPCISKYRAESSSPGNNCPTCYLNKPCQLVSTDETRQLQLDESVVKRCFLDIEDYPVYVISVIGERRSGKSFLMNYLMRVLRNLEKKKVLNFGAENEPLNGFPCWPGTDKVTEGIWIWGKPFILENNGNKMAVFLLDTEGTKNTTSHKTVSMKLFLLTMMISSHLVYNVKDNVKETNIDYLEIYCDPNENDSFHPFFALKYFDILVRDRPESEDCETDFAKSYIEEQIQNQSKRDMKSVLPMVEEKKVQCFLMPHPGVAIAEGEIASLRDMDEDFKHYFKRYLIDVMERTKKCIPVMTCRKLAAKLKKCVEYVQNERKFSSPLELCDRLKTQVEKNTEQEKENIKTEFQDFLKEQTRLKSPNQMSTVVSEKAIEIITNFHERFPLTSYEQHRSLAETLMNQLKGEGDNFCATQSKFAKTLKVGIHAGLATASAAAITFLLPAMVPAAAAGGFLSTIGAWFFAAPAAASVSGTVISAAVGGATLLQAGAEVVLRKFL